MGGGQGREEGGDMLLVGGPGAVLLLVYLCLRCEHVFTTAILIED